jgi:hypothetical protein
MNIPSLTDLSQLGTGALIVVALFVAYNIVRVLAGKDLKSREVNLSSNHLTHIEAAIREQTQLFQQDHLHQTDQTIEMVKALTRIETKLDNLK